MPPQYVSLESPEASAGILSRLLFLWVYPLLRLAYSQGTLSLSDLPPTLVNDNPGHCHSQLLAHFPSCPSLFTALFHSNLSTVIYSGLLLLFSSLCGFLTPIILERLLELLQQSSSFSLTQGLVLSGVLFLANVLKSISEHQFWITGIRACLRAQSSLMAAVYRKALVLSPASRTRHPPGAILSLLSVDCCRILDQSLVPILHWGTWYSILMVGVSSYFLAGLLGLAALAGLSIIVVLYPLGMLVSRRYKLASTAVQHCRDARAALLSDSLHCIALLKTLHWEEHALERIQELRTKELGAQYSRLLLGGLLYALSSLTQLLSPAVSLLLYFIYSKELQPSTAFAALAWFSVLNRPLSLLPTALTAYHDVLVSLHRLEEFLGADEVYSLTYKVESDDESKAPLLHTLAVKPLNSEDCNFSANTYTGRVELAGASFWYGDHCAVPPLDISLAPGTLVMVVGPVASGKSTLLAGLHGEVACRGTRRVASDAMLVAEPWVQAQSLRANILFGAAFHRDRYLSVLSSVGLDADLADLEFGDATLLGQHGTGLSGGQRLRVALARAAYADASVYLLDEVLASLDQAVGARVFQSCIVDLLGGKTRVLSTHHTQYLEHPAVDWIIVLGSGGGIHAQGSLATLQASADAYTLSLLTSPTPRAASTPVLHSSPTPIHDPGPGHTAAVVDEASAAGAVEWRVMARYLRYTGWVWLALVFLAEQGLVSLNSLWVSLATTASPAQAVHLAIYSGLAPLVCIAALLRQVLVVHSSVRAAASVHADACAGVLAAPLGFFDTGLTGRVLNRLLADQSTVDSTLPTVLSNTAVNLLLMGGTVALVSAVLPPLVGVFLALLVPYYCTSRFYSWAARDTRRLESVARSPIYAHLQESLAGRPVIRSMGAEAEFFAQHLRLSEDFVRCCWARWSANQWVTVWVELLGSLFTLCACLLSVYAAKFLHLGPSLVGLVLSSALKLPGILGWFLKLAIVAEVEAVSLERLFEYIDLEPARVVPKGQPSTHSIVIKDLCMRYTPESPWILDHVSLTLDPGAKVAVVGRTGSGKSSLFNAILQLYDFTGEVRVQGDIGVLRQQPLVYGDTLRAALCGPRQVPDVHLYEMLHRVRVDLCLDTPVASLSAGQTQLVCLARCLLAESPVLLCDEVSSSMDQGTDALIHDLLLGLSATVVSICHRLDHIHRFDWVVVMDRGRVVDQGPPAAML